MKFCLFLVLLLACFCSPTFALRVDSIRRSFDGFQVLRANVSTAKQLKLVQELQEENHHLDFWTFPSTSRGTDIMVPLEYLESLKQNLTSAHVPFSVMIEDVERVVTREKKEIDSAKSSSVLNNISKRYAYHPFDSISNWLDKLASEHPEICTTEVIGHSTEGRELKLVKISLRNGKRKKPSIWIDAGIHGREWISPATATFFIHHLVTRSIAYSELLEKVDFYILPIVNPDGYAYTWTRDRLWRKTRSHYSSKCRGVDANRNFGYKFGEAGSVSDPCAATFRGPEPFSEPETRSIRDFILKTRSIRAYLTLHSYGQYWLYPWGYTSELPPDWKELDSLARQAVKAIERRSGFSYSVGSANLLGTAAGRSADWAKSVNIKYSYTIVQRDTGYNGFLLPENMILPTALETWEGVLVVARHVAATEQ